MMAASKPCHSRESHAMHGWGAEPPWYVCPGVTVVRTFRQAMFLKFDDGHSEYSPDVQVAVTDDNTLTLTPIVPFRRVGASDE